MAAPKVPEGCPLTPRQFEILELLADGKTHDEVAQTLKVAGSTVRDHASNAFRALECSNTAQAVAEMGRRGWLGWVPADDASPLAVKHPFLAAYVAEFQRSRWPHNPDASTALGMKLALAGHRNQIRSSPKEGA